MLKPAYFNLLFFLFFAIGAFGQNAQTDSLIRLLNKAPQDTNKVHLYWKTGASIIYQNPLASIPFFKSGTALSEKLGFISGLEKCNNATSLAFSLNAKYDSALVYINHAVFYAVKAGNIKRLSLAYLNRADVFVNLKNYPAALTNCDTAIVYAEQVKNYDGLGRIYSIMSVIYEDLNQYTQAMACLDKSDYYFSFTKNRQMVAMNYAARGDLLVLLNQPETAVNWYRKAIPITDSLEDVENLSANYGAMGEALYKIKKYKEAEAAFILALNYATQTENTRQQAVVFSNLSKMEREQNHIQKSIDYGLKAYTLIKQENDSVRQQGMAANLSDAYLKNGNTLKAYEFLKISSNLSDGIVKHQFSSETVKQQASFEMKQKEREIALLNKNKELQQQKLQKQRLLMFGAAALALFALAGIWLLINRNKLKQRMKELELRNQIAADLHDEVGSSLSSIYLLSQMATQKGNEAMHKNILTRMSTNAKETMDKMGDIVWMIKPRETEASSLKQRMEGFAYELFSSKNIEASMQLEELEKIKLSMGQRKNIWLIFKEAVNNTVKYSETEKIVITVSIQNKELRMQIKDFGKGFDSNAIKKGNGLDNMQHRAHDVGGSLHVQSEAGMGTELVLYMPL